MVFLCTRPRLLTYGTWTLGACLMQEHWTVFAVHPSAVELLAVELLGKQHQAMVLLCTRLRLLAYGT